MSCGPFPYRNSFSGEGCGHTWKDPYDTIFLLKKALREIRDQDVIVWGDLEVRRIAREALEQADDEAD